jgi:hypothetical protein
MRPRFCVDQFNTLRVSDGTSTLALFRQPERCETLRGGSVAGGIGYTWGHGRCVFFPGLNGTKTGPTSGQVGLHSAPGSMSSEIQTFVSSKLGDVPIGEYYLYVTLWQNNKPRYLADALYSFLISADNKAEPDRIISGHASSNQPGWKRGPQARPQRGSLSGPRLADSGRSAVRAIRR